MIKHTMRWLSLAVIIAAIMGLLLYPAHPATPIELSVSVPSDVADGMGAIGYVLAPPPADASRLVRVSLAEAIAVANENAGRGNPASAALALFSDAASQMVDVEAGAIAGTPVGPQGRLVYVLIFDGLELYPVGPRSEAPMDRAPVVHHELVVIVDGETGEFLQATTFR